MPPKDAKAAKGKDAKAAKGAKGGAAPPPSDKPKGPKLPVPLDGPPLEPVKVIPPPYDPRVNCSRTSVMDITHADRTGSRSSCVLRIVLGLSRKKTSGPPV